MDADGAAVLPLSDPQALLAPSRAPELARGCVHVWSWPLSAAQPTLEQLEVVLDEVERRRAARFVRPEHGRRFTVAHGVVRIVLARYTGDAPEALRFSRSAGGKPELAASAVHFNLSHSADRAVLAISRATVGVDVEHARSRLDPLGLASRYFFGDEHEAIRAAPEPARGATFLRYWVAKEAVLKAEGVGLAFPLDAFAIVFAPDGATASVTSNDPVRLSPTWTVRMLSLGNDWPVAVAAAGDAWSVLPCGTGTGSHG